KTQPGQRLGSRARMQARIFSRRVCCKRRRLWRFGTPFGVPQRKSGNSISLNPYDFKAFLLVASAATANPLVRRLSLPQRDWRIADAESLLGACLTALRSDPDDVPGTK